MEIAVTKFWVLGPLNFFYDQLIINCDEKDVEMFAPIVQQIMQDTTELPGVTLKAPPEISNNWRDGH